MKRILSLLVFTVAFAVCHAQTKPPSSAQAERPSCLIVKHASTARQFFVSGANWQYVAGDFPKGMKWKSNIRDRDIRKIKEMGGRVVVIRPDYSADDLAQAQKACVVDMAQDSSEKKP
jgi:hypothetical protein